MRFPRIKSPTAWPGFNTLRANTVHWRTRCIQLPVAKVQAIEPYGVAGHFAIAVLLIIDRDCVPTGLPRRTGDVHIVSDTIQGNGFEKQLIGCCSGHLNHKVIPRIVLGIARNSSRDPFLVYVIVCVPLVATCNSALVAPDETLGSHELIDVELKCLGSGDVICIEIDVVDEIVKTWNQGVTGVINPLGRKVPDDVVVPKNIRIGMGSADVVISRGTTQGRRGNKRRTGPIHAGRRRRAASANAPARWKQSIS